MTTYLYPSGSSQTTVRDPDVEPEENTTVQVIGSSQRAVDGTLRQHRIAKKRRWVLTWTLLTEAELSAIEAMLDNDSTLEFKPPTLGTTYTVLLVDQYERFHNGIGWGIRATLEEV